MDIQILLVLAVLTVTIILLVTEALRVDLVAAIIMVSLAWLGLVPPLQAFSGLASNGVIAMAAVMVLGCGIDRTGVMARSVSESCRLQGPTSVVSPHQSLSPSARSPGSCRISGRPHSSFLPCSASPANPGFRSPDC